MCLFSEQRDNRVYLITNNKLCLMSKTSTLGKAFTINSEKRILISYIPTKASQQLSV